MDYDHMKVIGKLAFSIGRLLDAAVVAAILGELCSDKNRGTCKCLGLQ